MDLLKSKDGQIVFFITEPRISRSIALKGIGYQAKAQPLLVILYLSNLFLSETHSREICKRCENPCTMIHGIVTILNACLIEHGFRIMVFQIISSLVSVLESKLGTPFPCCGVVF